MLQNKYNMSMWQGSTFGLTISIKYQANNLPRNITGQNVRMQIRSTYDAETPEDTLSTDTGEITITDGANGTFHIELSAARTANLEVDLSSLSTVKISDTQTVKIPKTVYVYDMELINGADVSKILYGDVNVYGEVTRNV
jgi:hypothetical protein